MSPSPRSIGCLLTPQEVAAVLRTDVNDVLGRIAAKEIASVGDAWIGLRVPAAEVRRLRRQQQPARRKAA